MPDEKSTLLDVSTKAPAPDSVRDQEVAVHHIRAVGGGAAGLELVTRLGDTLGRHGRARITLIEKGRTHLWKRLLHAIAAGSMDPGGHELNYLAQAHWHHFRYRFGEMIGLDRTKKEVWIAATHDDERWQITLPRAFRCDTLVIDGGSVTNDFGTPGVSQYAVPLEGSRVISGYERRDSVSPRLLLSQTRWPGTRPEERIPWKAP